MEGFYYKEMAALQDEHWWYEGRRQILRTVIGQLALSENAKILEAGCGPGANLNMLKEFGNVQAFEPDEFAAQHAYKISGIEVQQGGLPDPFPFEGQGFDMIGAFDVIEHIEDDLGALQKLSDHLMPGGSAVFTVPAHQWMWSAHDEVNDHKRRYSKKGFKSVLQQAGFYVEDISYYNMWLFPPAILVRFLKKTLKSSSAGQKESDVKMPHRFVNGILRSVFASEKYILPFMPLPMGLSIIAVCRK